MNSDEQGIAQMDAPFGRELKCSDYIELNEIQIVTVHELCRNYKQFIATIAASGVMLGCSLGLFSDDLSNPIFLTVAPVSLILTLFAFTYLRVRLERSKQDFTRMITIRCENKLMRKKDKEDCLRVSKIIGFDEGMLSLINNAEFSPYTDKEIKAAYADRKSSCDNPSPAMRKQYKHLIYSVLISPNLLDVYILPSVLLMLLFAISGDRPGLTSIFGMCLIFTMSLALAFYYVRDAISTAKKECLEGRYAKNIAECNPPKRYTFLKFTEHLIFTIISCVFLYAAITQSIKESSVLMNSIVGLSAAFTFVCIAMSFYFSIRAANAFKRMSKEKV